MNKEIKNQLYNAIALMGGKEDILSIIVDIDNSDQDTLKRLKDWNLKKTDEIKNRLDITLTQSIHVQHYS